MTQLVILYKLPYINLSSSLSSSQLIRMGRSTVEMCSHRRSIGVPEQHRIRTSIKCMATPRRVAMVAKQIRRELSDMLLTDKNLQYAVLPEAALGADRYLSSVTTISDVEVSTDLQVIFCFIFLMKFSSFLFWVELFGLEFVGVKKRL